MEYVVYGPNGDYSRDTFISANREGIFSCAGFLAIYYFGVETGRTIHLIKRYVCMCSFFGDDRSINYLFFVLKENGGKRFQAVLLCFSYRPLVCPGYRGDGGDC